MQFVYYSQKDQLLDEISSYPGIIEYITPSPAKADILRSKLVSKQTQDAITIAKFTSNLLEALWEDSEKPKIKRKSELLLIFGILKNKYLPELKYEQFNQAYNLFSDLRSFSLDLEALGSILDDQPEIIKEAIIMFWKLLELTGFCDEHGAYQLISEKLRSSEELESLNKTYVFWGFQHLNGQQIDLIKSLSIRYKIIIPFPYELKNKLKRTDWITWLKEGNAIEKDLPQIQILPKANWIPTNSREITANLKNILKDSDQIIIGVSKLSSSHVDIVPSAKVSFKVPFEILKNELVEIYEKIKSFHGTHLDLKKFILDELKNCKNFKLIRGWQLYQESLIHIEELTDEEMLVDHFFVKLLSDVAGLNQPRTSFIPVSNVDLTIDLKDMSSIESMDSRRRVILCIDERFDEILSLGQNYSEAIQKALTVIGPVKRNELELLFRVWEFKDLLSRSEVLILMHEGVLKHNIVWKRMFSSVSLNLVMKENKIEEALILDVFKKKINKVFEGSYSASKIQTFIDCPRKFYFNYVEKMIPDLHFNRDIDPMTSGSIIHEIIEVFFKQNLQPEELKQLTSKTMSKYISENDLIISPELYAEKELVFYHRAKNGITFVKQLEALIPEDIEWNFEKPFKIADEVKINGIIDCIGVSSRYIILLDFKSTVFSASSTTDVLAFDAVQLWIYAMAVKQQFNDLEKKNIIMGYVVLDGSADSNLLTNDEDFLVNVKLQGLCKVQKFKEDFELKLNQANARIINLGKSISEEKLFPAKPRKSNACIFCELNKLCLKGEVGHVK